MLKFIHVILSLSVSGLLSFAQELQLGLPIGHGAGVSSLQFSPNNEFLLTAEEETSTVILWETSTGKLIHHWDKAGSMASFNSDYTEIVSVQSNRLIRRWDMVTGAIIDSSYLDRPMFSPDLIFSPDRKFLICPNSDGSIEIRDIRSTDLTHVLAGHEGGVNGISFLEDKSLLISSGSDQTIKIWSIYTGELIQSVDNSAYGVAQNAIVSPDASKLAIVVGTTIVVRDLVGDSVLSELRGHFYGVKTAVFSKDGSKLATAADGARVWDIASSTLIHRSGSAAAIPSETLTFYKSDSILLHGSTLYDISTGNVLKDFNLEFKKPDGSFISSNRYHPSADGQYVVSCSSFGPVSLWDIEKAKYTQTFASSASPLIDAFFLNNGKHFVTLSKGGWLNKINHSTGVSVWSIKIHSENIADHKYIPFKDWLITASYDGTLKLWDLNNESLIRSEKESYVDWLFLSKSSKYLASNSSNELQLRNTEDLQVLFEFGRYNHSMPGMRVAIMAFDINPEETKLAINFEGNVEVYDITTGKSMFLLEGSNAIGGYGYGKYKGRIYFSANGEQIITQTQSSETLSYFSSETGKLMMEEKIAEESKAHHTVSPDSSLYIDADVLKATGTAILLVELPDFQEDYNKITFSPDSKNIIAASDDGSTTLWNVTNGTSLRNFFFENDPDKWVHLSQEGFFDASPEAMKSMYWTKGTDVIEFSQLKDRFWVPGLWESVIKQKPLPKIDSRQLKALGMYPKIVLKHPQENNDQLGIRLYNQGGGYGPVNILINGKEVVSDARETSFDGKSDSITINYDLSNHPFLRRGEVNTIEVSAYNEESYVQSRPKKIYYIPNGAKSQYAPTLYAVIVGSADYVGTDIDLNYPSKDAKAISSAIEMAANRLLGVGQVNVHLLTTDLDGSNWPSKNNIRRAFAKIASQAKPYDVLVLYFAGHGVNLEGAASDFYYLSAAAGSGRLIDPVIREKVAISSAELTEWINDIPALKQVLIFDACHSGQFTEDLLEKRQSRTSSEIKSLERMKDRTGMYILSGSAADAVSYEASIYGQGLLTYSLLFGMKGASLRDGRFIDVVRLFQFAADKVPELAQNIGGIQKPEIRVPLGGESFDIGIINTEDKHRIVLPSPKPIFVRSIFQNQSTFDDDLMLSNLTDESLKETQHEANNKIVFVDAPTFSDAFSIRGQYKRKKDKITLAANLLNEGVVVKSYTLKGTDQQSLIKELLDNCFKETNQTVTSPTPIK